jgi:hypothetical protein
MGRNSCLLSLVSICTHSGKACVFCNDASSTMASHFPANLVYKRHLDKKLHFVGFYRSTYEGRGCGRGWNPSSYLAQGEFLGFCSVVSLLFNKTCCHLCSEGNVTCLVTELAAG